MHPHSRPDFPRLTALLPALALLIAWAPIHTARPATHTPASPHAPDFLRDVRPILAAHCLKCHGPDESARKGSLRLDLREEALRPAKSGARSIVPGNPAQSELLTRILSDDKEEVMPPPATKHELSSDQKDVLQRWIASGAEYRPHWAFTAPRKSPVPFLPNAPAKLHPVDAFIQARLSAEHLAPSAPADRLTLLRRVSLDLTGLPPTAEEADAFLQNPAPDAYAQLVERLIASPHYGERWARKWLDLARYADTNGYEKDRPRTIWPYRDWVIRVLNADLPFDQFTIQQLAGDLLPSASEDHLVATGFHRNTMLNEEGGIDPLEFRFHAMTDRVATTGATWLGLTTGCAQCHTHKYDPLLHTDYFALMAFLNNADEPELELHDPSSPDARKRTQELAAKLLAELPSRWPTASPSANNRTDNTRWITPTLSSATTASGQPPQILEDHSALFNKSAPPSDTFTLVLESPGGRFESLRLEALTHPSLPSSGPGRTPHGNFVLSEIRISAQPLAHPAAPPAHVLIRSATADAEQPSFPVSAAFDGSDKTGWAVHVHDQPLNTNKSAVFHFAQPAGFEGGTRWTVTLAQSYGTMHTLGRARLSLGAPAPISDAAPAPQKQDPASALQTAFQQWLEKQRHDAVTWATPRPSKATSNLPLLTIQDDLSVLASGDITKDDTYTLSLPLPKDGRPVTALRLEALPHPSLPGGGPGLAYYEGPKGDFFLGELQVLADGAPAKIASASESYSKNNFGNQPANALLATDGDPQTGWSAAKRAGEAHEAVFVFEKPLTASSLAITLRFGRHYACSLGRFRLSVTSDPRGAEASQLPAELQSLLVRPAADLTAAQQSSLREHFLLHAPELAEHAKRIQQLLKPAQGTTTLVLRERPSDNPRPTFLHHRGEFLQPKQRIEPGVPSFLPPLPAGAPRNRLGFAQWLVSRENPLTARVVVNRHWAAFFGTGLVRTLNDFGFQGETPTHPELLDWLAVEFMDKGWSIKQLHRLLVTSATYCQSARTSPELLARDPQNRLLARAPRPRVDAELVRDLLLHSSGLLSSKMYGPPVRPPQPAGVTEAAYGAPKWEASAGEDRYRRALYTFQKRSAPFAMLNTFDAPSGEVCIARREISNTPLQSLTLLNDEVVLECARTLGRATAAQAAPDDPTRLHWLFKRCLTRPPRDAETAALLQFLQTQRTRLQKGELSAAALLDSDKDPSPEAAAWTTLARSLLNLDEFITRN